MKSEDGKLNKKLCPHGLKLDRNLRCDKGRIQILIRRKTRPTICLNIGPHTRDAQAVANIKLAEFNKQFLEGHIGIEPELPSKKFEEVCNVWFSIWGRERRPDGTEAHNSESCYKVKWTLDKVLIPVFGKLNFHEIKSNSVDRWRRTYTAKGLSGVTANRYQAILSSIFAHTDRWVKTERIRPAFKVPITNPCDAVEMAPSVRRERILSKYEASKLKLAFIQLNDSDGWEICKLALKSVLSLKDLKGLEIGSQIDIPRSKTGVRVNLPITNLVQLNWFGWRTRWEKAREQAGLVDFQFRDLRKTGINWLKGSHDLKLISEYAGHANVKTTEKSYTISRSEYLEPLARDIENQVDSI